MNKGIQLYFKYLTDHKLEDTSERRDLWKTAWNLSADDVACSVDQAMNKVINKLQVQIKAGRA